MIRNLLSASLIVVSQAFAAEPSPPTDWSRWEIALTRTDPAGKILSQAKAPLAVYRVGDFDAQLVINMGTATAPRLWTVECWYGGEGDKLLEFEVSDTTRITSWTNDGDSSSRAAELFDIETSWRGAGRYLVFTMDGETLTADIHPVAGAGTDQGDGADPAVIVVTRRDRSRTILSQTTAPWPAANADHDFRQTLAIRFVTKDGPQTRLVQCTADMNSLRFRVEALLPIQEEIGGTQVRRLQLLQTRSPIHASGKYLIHDLDGETLEAEIRPTGGVNKEAAEDNGK